MKKLFTLGIIFILVILTGCRTTKTYDYNKDNYTLDEYYNNMSKIAYVIEGNDVHIFKDINKDAYKLDLDDVIRTDEKISKLDHGSYVNNDYDLNVYHTNNEFSYFGNDFTLKYTTNNYLPFISYNEMSSTSLKINALVICNITKNDCIRKDVTITQGYISALKAVNNNRFFVIISDSTKFELLYIDENMNITEVYKSNKGRFVDYDKYNGNYILLKNLTDTSKMELVLLDLSEYDYKKADSGIKSTSKEFPFSESNAYFNLDNEKIYYENLTTETIRVFDLQFNQIEDLSLNGHDFISMVNDQYMVLKGDSTLTTDNQKVGTAYLFDYVNKVSYEINTLGISSYNYRNVSGPRNNTPIIVGNKYFFNRDLKSSSYFDFETKTVTELDYQPVSYSGKYLTNKAVVLKLSCNDPMYAKLPPEVRPCTTEQPKATIYHEDYGYINDLQYTDYFAIDSENYFYVNNGKLVAYNFNSKQINEIVSVSQKFEVMKYNGSTYIIRVDGEYYQYKDGHLTNWEHFNQLKSE